MNEIAVHLEVNCIHFLPNIVIIFHKVPSAITSSMLFVLQVNIDHFTKDVTLRNLVDLSTNTFDLAQSRIYTLMEKDSFGRFLRSEQYQDLIK